MDLSSAPPRRDQSKQSTSRPEERVALRQNGKLYCIAGIHHAIWFGSMDAYYNISDVPWWLLHKYQPGRRHRARNELRATSRTVPTKSKLKKDDVLIMPSVVTRHHKFQCGGCGAAVSNITHWIRLSLQCSLFAKDIILSDVIFVPERRSLISRDLNVYPKGIKAEWVFRGVFS